MDRYEKRVLKLREHVLSHNNQEEGNRVPKTLDDLTVDELKELAKEKELEGYSKLKRDELIALLKEGN